jgi:GntR family transcriptional regulator
MFIRIERGGSTPISRQIAEQMRAQCLSGSLTPGQCLPSVRQLAKELVVNVNTVVRVYERLAAEGLVEMRQGEGTFVLSPAAKNQVAADLDDQREQLTRDLQAVVRRGVMLGIAPAELRRMLSEAIRGAKEQFTRR